LTQIILLDQCQPVSFSTAFIVGHSCADINAYIQAPAPFTYTEEDIDYYYSAYNAIKHNRNEETIYKGNIRFLLRAMAALFLLNIYFRDERFYAIDGFKFDVSLGSSIFSIDIYTSSLSSILGAFDQTQQEKAVYLLNVDEKILEEFRNSEVYKKFTASEIKIEIVGFDDERDSDIKPDPASINMVSNVMRNFLKCQSAYILNKALH